MEICIFRLRVWATVHVCCLLMIGEVPLHGKVFFLMEQSVAKPTIAVTHLPVTH